jgi:minor histocompatibility antigen H13
MVIYPTLIVYIGCHRSMTQLEVDADGKSVKEKESITMEDAQKFPLVASCSLGGLFLAFKFLDQDMVNMVLNGYISVAGVFTITGTFSPIFSDLSPGLKKTVTLWPDFEAPLLGKIEGTFSCANFVSFAMAVAFNWGYFVSGKHFMLNNIFGISFCVQAIEAISLQDYKTGAALLSGLFFYDIFWVFGTASRDKGGDSVMETVAKKFDGPIKILFPKETLFIVPTAWGCAEGTVFDVPTLINGSLALCKAAPTAVEVFTYLATNGPVMPDGLKDQSLLGLGDIVLPGLFVAMLLRYDASKANVDPAGGATTDFPKPFFYTNICFYAGGLVVTIMVMNIFKVGQPALLYLVPACVGGSALTALVTGQFTPLLAYTEIDAEENVDSKDKKNE